MSADLRVGCRRGTRLLPAELPHCPTLRALLSAAKPFLRARRLRSRRPSPGAEEVQPRRARLWTLEGEAPAQGPGQSWSLRLPQPRIRVAPAAAGPCGRGRGWARASPSSAFWACCSAYWCSCGVAEPDLAQPLKTPPPDTFPNPLWGTSRRLPFRIISHLFAVVGTSCLLAAAPSHVGFFCSY